MKNLLTTMVPIGLFCQTQAADPYLSIWSPYDKLNEDFSNKPVYLKDSHDDVFENMAVQKSASILPTQTYEEKQMI